ncbi:hypothetical protein DFP74_2702 [Nocardiopsis sp. Huas11]|uniref:hypothetical protein n=1 Tax=Nocardiopsis sp. Huas11 TaxID=2183912 RepID=UPI000F2D87B7|nr:hypothetical protein [Nocardiopsis sp. Huas11]RKS07048.1 hypothetical protein DFP74_2702 [Nocardiopsis sp. Huas11]
MRTSMPYTPPIVITSEDVAALRERGPGACLTWHEDTAAIEAVTPREALDPRRMIIASHRGLGEVADQHTEDGRQATEDDLASDLTDIASDYAIDWPQIRTMNLMCQDLRDQLADTCAYLAAPPIYEDSSPGAPRMTDHYRLTGGQRIAHVTVTWAFTEPTRIRTRDPIDDRRAFADLTLATGGMLTHRVISDLIAGTVWQTLDQNH